jgi:hypothetical protein
MWENFNYEMKRSNLLMMNDNDIKEMMLNYSTTEPDEFYGVYAVKKASFATVMLLGSLASFAHKYCVIGFNGKEFIIVGLDMLGKPVSGAAISVNSIKSTKVTGWLFGMGKAIHITFIDNTKIKFNVNKLTIGLKEQKSNLIELERLLG